MTQDEIAVMGGGKCILQLRGVRRSFRISTTLQSTRTIRWRCRRHDKKNTFDVERYMKRRPAIVKPDEPFDCYEISGADLQEDAGNE